VLKKIVALKNIGRFANSSAPGNPQLLRHTLITGANGYGKTTICSVLRSLNMGDAAQLVGRKTLGATGDQVAELLLDTGLVRFDGAAWNGPGPAMSIFDGVFVAENVYSGEHVDIDQKRGLYRIIVGDAGVKLAAEDTDLAAKSRGKTAEITASAKAILTHFPKGMMIEDVLNLAAIDDIDTQTEATSKQLEAVQQADAIAKRALLTEYPLPQLPANLVELLGKTLEGLSQEAEAAVTAHLAAHGMKDGGGNWVAEALPHAQDTCPFCGQDIRAIDLIGSYRNVFSQRYRDFRTELEGAAKAIRQAFGDGALAQLETTAEKNAGGAEFWGKYCTFDPGTIGFPPSTIAALRGLQDAALSLLERKSKAPLEALAVDEPFTLAMSQFDEALAVVQSVNTALRQVNELIAQEKAATGAADVAAVQSQLAALRATKKRYSEPVAPLCATHLDLVKAKADLDDQRETVRQALDKHTKSVIKPYERRINDYLDAFNAGFTIAETTHSYPGGVATSTYQLVINQVAVGVGDGKTPATEPSFKNTLSAGDRTTLALAVFLAHLERDPGLGDRVVVFDDPFNSQDSFRRRQTVHEIMKVAAKCRQIIVFSHDATFLKQIWDKATPADRVALGITDHRDQGSKISEIDLEKTTAGRTASEIDDLQAYLTTGAGVVLDIVKKMRGVLETYCRTTYPAYFAATDWLGDIVGKIRVGGAGHPAAALYDELDQINDYTKQYHHGEDMGDTTPDQIDPTELTGFTRRTLKIVNALQA